MFGTKKIPYRFQFLLQSIALLFIGACLLLTPTFTMLKTNTTVINAMGVSKENGYGFLDNFSLLLGQEDAKFLRIQGWTCAFNWIILICGIAALLGGIGCIIACFASARLANANRYDAAVVALRNVLLAALVTALTLMIVYAVLGFVLLGRSLRLIEEYEAPKLTRKLFSTAAYFPLIVSIVFTVLYFLVVALLSEPAPKSVARAFGALATEQERMKLIGEYKVLFDQGVLTEEEFVTRKRALLFPEAKNAEREAAPAIDSIGESGKTDAVSLLLEYKKLWDEGVITESEFEQRKAALLEKSYS